MSPFGTPVPVFHPSGPAGGEAGYHFPPAAAGPGVKSSRRRVVIALTAVMALVVAGGVGFVRLHSGPSYPTHWDPRITSIVAFVEKERGLKFSHPVTVDFMPVAKFKAKMGDGKAPTAQDKVDMEHLLGVMRAMGVVHGDADLAAMETQISETSIIGLYVPKDKEVFVRGDQLTADVRVTLAHELTHALQDQHGDLGRLDNLKGADQGAVQALIEGDAVRVEDAYASTLSAADSAEYQKVNGAESSAANLKSVSEVLIDQADFPYIFGPVFVNALVASGGTAAIDRALANPPTVDAQIIDPNRYLIQAAVPKVPAPKVPPGAKRLATPSPFGEVGMLESIGATVGYQATWTALAGWQADQSVEYLKASRACISITAAFDTSAHAAAFAKAAQPWAAARSAASVGSVADDVQLQSCDPGAAAPGGPVVSPSPFEVLSVRASFMGAMLGGGKVPADVAACIADGVVATLGPATFVAANDYPDGDARLIPVARALTQSALACGYTGPAAPTSG